MTNNQVSSSSGKTPAGLLPRVLLFLMPLLWSASGCLLLFRGWRLLDLSLIGFILPAALLIGILKSVFILDRIANANHLSFSQPEKHSIFSCQLTASPTLRKTWRLIPLMIFLAIGLRSLPGAFAPLIVTLYWAVGCSLCFSSRLIWCRSYKTLRCHGFA